MSFVAKGLQAFGALALAVAVAIIGYVIYIFASNSDQTNTAMKADVLFVLNWGGLKPSQEYKVLSSFISGRSLNGDHLDHYCIQITDFSPSASEKQNWSQVSALGSTAQEAALQAQTNGDAEQCFGRELGKSPELQAYIWSVTIHGHVVTAYDIILFDPQTKRLLYVSDKT
jgi:hypothetical protein